MKKIFEYTDYREWLRDAFEDFKQRKTVISWRYMAMKMGADPGNLLRVSQGKIHLPLSLIQPAADFFELEGKEADYWAEMVYFGRAKTDADALQHYERMQALKGVSLKLLQKKELEFYRHWYYNAIRSVIGICKFKDDYQGLAESCTPNITEKEARDAVKLLADLNMISMDRDGYWKVNDTFFQHETIRLADESLDRHQPFLRDISTVTMTFCMDDIQLLREKINAFREDLLRLSQEGTDDDTVFQLNIQMFPLAFTKPLKEKGK